MTTDELRLQIQATEDVSVELADATSTMGALKPRINMQEEFARNLINSIKSGVCRLVDANMNQESTRLKALQTQQQLGIQALTIANSSSNTLLSLFN